METPQKIEQGTETAAKTTNTTNTSSRSWLFWLALVFLLCVFLSQAYLYIFFGTTWLDESDYLYTGSQIFERNLILYDQIWTRMPPILFYFYGYSQTFIGPSMEMGRLFSFLATTLFLIASYFIVKNTTKSKFAGLLAVAFIVLHQKALSFYLRANAAVPTALAIMLILWALSLDIKEKIKFPLAFFFASIMLMTRMNTIFLFIALIVYMLIVVQEKIKTALISAGISLIIITSIMIKFLMINWKNTLLGIFAPFTVHIYPSLFYTTANKESWLAMPYEIFRSLQSLGVLVAIAIPLLVYFVMVLRESWVKQAESKTGIENKAGIRHMLRALFALLMKHHFMVFLIVGFLSIFLTHFWADDTYVFYVTPILAVIASIGTYQIIKKFESENQHFTKKLIISFVIGLLLFSLSGFTILGLSNPLAGDSDIARAKKSGAIIANLTEPEATIFIADNEIAQLLYANRKTFPPMTARYYLFTTDNNTPFIKATNRFNMEILNNHLANESDYVLIQSNRGWLKLNKPPILENVTALIEDQLQKNYEPIIDIPNAVPKTYEYGNGTLSLYKRIPKEKSTETDKKLPT